MGSPAIKPWEADADDTSAAGFLAWLAEQATMPVRDHSQDVRPACECGALEHVGETHEAALACEEVEAHTACDCGGYFVDGEVVHDGYCALETWRSDPTIDA